MKLALDLGLENDTSYLVLKGKLYYAFCELFGEIWLSYDKTAQAIKETRFHKKA